MLEGLARMNYRKHHQTIEFLVSVRRDRFNLGSDEKSIKLWDY